MGSRDRNFWGWGWADKFPDEEGRRTIGEQLTGMLGFEEVELLDPPTLEDIDIESPRVDLPETLDEICTQSKRQRVEHAYGKAYRDLVRGFHRIYDAVPDVVAHPKTETDIAHVLDWCAEDQLAAIPFGGGTSVVGGVEASAQGARGVVSLDMRGMDRVLDVEPESLAARVQAGAVGPRISEQLDRHDLSFRHYPQSYEFSTLGGWIATRAGGHFATRYTHIDDLLESVRMISPSGDFETRRLPASGAGPDPNRLVLGSEGTLGVITEAWIRVQRPPRFRSKASVFFDDYENAVDACRVITQSGLTPANCRLLDSREAMLNGVAFDGSHVLLLGFESAIVPTRHDMDHALDICEVRGGFPPDDAAHTDTHEADGEKAESDAGGTWKSSFFEGPYLQNTMVSLGVIADTFETACTWDAFEELHASIIRNMKDAMERVCGQGFISCRFTHVYPDGPAPYYTFLAPATVGSELTQWQELKSVASDTLEAHAATITHHHAVGRTHGSWYYREVPQLFQQAMRAAKREFDPDGVLNPDLAVSSLPR
jgi:alkyldihydroxyacetonephosphate synthase